MQVIKEVGLQKQALDKEKIVTCCPVRKDKFSVGRVLSRLPTEKQASYGQLRTLSLQFLC